VTPVARDSVTPVASYFVTLVSSYYGHLSLVTLWH